MADHGDLLVAEYESCAQLANHVDNVRNVITSFFLTINGGVLIVATQVAKGEVRDEAFGSPEALLAGVLGLVCLLGTLFTGTVARLRRVQSEGYQVANRILDHFLKTPELRGIVALETAHLAEDAGGSTGLRRRTTGTYLWSLAIMLPTAVLAAAASYLVVTGINGWGPPWVGLLVASVLFAAALIAEDHLYFRLSTFHSPTGCQRPPSEAA